MILCKSIVLVDVFRFAVKLDEWRDVLVARDFWWCQEEGGFRGVFGEEIAAEARSLFEPNNRRVLGDDDSLFMVVEICKARKGLSVGRLNVERWTWLLLRKKLGGERVLVNGEDFGLLLVVVETFWHELAWLRRAGTLRMIGELQRGDDASVKELRFRILDFGLVAAKRRLFVVVALVVVVVVVTVEDEETSSGSVESVGGTGGVGGEVARFFDVSSVSFSFQIRRDTAQRCICRLDRRRRAVLLFVDINRKFSAEGVRFVNALFCWFCFSFGLNVE